MLPLYFLVLFIWTKPISKLLKSSLIEVERFLEAFCSDSIGKMFVFAQKKVRDKNPTLIEF